MFAPRLSQRLLRGIAGVLLLALAACTAPGAPSGPGSPGPSQASGPMCGGFAAIRCGEGQYCYMTPEQTRVPDMAGVCRPVPEVCTLEYHPVCGVDGRTYGNACDAAGHGVNVSRDGACTAP